METLTKIADRDITVGDPATYCIGSDHYGVEVLRVDRFKSGKRKGMVKEIAVSGHGSRIFRSHVNSRGEIVYLLVSDGRKQWYGQLVVGYARDYRDPSF